MATNQAAGSVPVCGTCHSNEYLVYERIRSMKNPVEGAPPLWDFDCWCGNCETFYGFTTGRPPWDPHRVQPPSSSGVA